MLSTVYKVCRICTGPDAFTGAISWDLAYAIGITTIAPTTDHGILMPIFAFDNEGAAVMWLDEQGGNRGLFKGEADVLSVDVPVIVASGVGIKGILYSFWNAWNSQDLEYSDMWLTAPPPGTIFCASIKLIERLL